MNYLIPFVHFRTPGFVPGSATKEGSSEELPSFVARQLQGNCRAFKGAQPPVTPRAFGAFVVARRLRFSFSVAVALAVGEQERDGEDEAADFSCVDGQPDAVRAQKGGQQEYEAQFQNQVTDERHNGGYLAIAQAREPGRSEEVDTDQHETGH